MKIINGIASLLTYPKQVPGTVEINVIITLSSLLNIHHINAHYTSGSSIPGVAQV